MAYGSDPCSSPAHKRQRCSSPFEEYFEELSYDDLDALDKLEAELLQSRSSPTKYSYNAFNKHKITGINSPSSEDKENFVLVPSIRGRSKSPLKASSSLSCGGIPRSPSTSGDSENPFIAKLPTFTSARHVQARNVASSFTSALQLRPSATLEAGQRSPSPEAPPNSDYSSWFAPTHVPLTSQFQSAKFAAASSISAPTTEFPAMGFMKASNKEWANPSHAALVQAKTKMEKWAEEADPHSPPVHIKEPMDLSTLITETPLPITSASCAVENPMTSKQYLDSPSPAITNTSASLYVTPGFDHLTKSVKPFKSPLLKVPHSPTPQTPPPTSNSASSRAFASAASHKPLLDTLGPETPPPNLVTRNSTFVTPLRSRSPYRRTAGATSTKPKFVTPFKPGMRPGEPGHKMFSESHKQVTGFNSAPGTSDSSVQRHVLSSAQEIRTQDTRRRKAFDLVKPPNRSTLATSGLVPQSYDFACLEDMGIDTMELSQITPTLALYYSFHTSSAIPLAGETNTSLGPSAALEELLKRGCSLATRPWVDNHWCLILWKLAGMVFLDPEAEHDPKRKRWCWSEIIRQLLYRYERELNNGSRPPLRLITTRDSPASLPMVLCISNITWPEAEIADGGSSRSLHPELEITDGWYRLRAEVDQALARAIRRGVIRVGRKIAVAAARLWSERKDPAEILDAYNSTKLIISGNSSQLAPWHAKLGFHSVISTSTLHSLNRDGGVIAVMDVVILKIYPLAFIEFIENEDGKTVRNGPRNQREEEQINEQWKRRREAEESKLHQAWEKKLRVFEDYADRLERRSCGRVEDGYSSDDMDAILSDLEENPEHSRILARVKPGDAGRLARLIREKVLSDHEKISQEIEHELMTTCPPRQTRNFRVLAVQDACTHKRPANRTAQLTVWDVLDLRISEDGEGGDFKVGQRFQITNLIPTHQKAWMGQAPGSEIYLCTRRDSKWMKIK